MIFGYVRVSTVTQNEKRQIENIKAKYPDAVIMVDKCTGTNMNRPAWSKLMKNLKAGDVVVFDEISRMSRNASEGFQVYQELYAKGIELIFLKESTLNTENFRNVAQVELTGTDVDAILKGINEYLMKLAENQIKSAFDTAQHEVDFLKQRTAEGVRRAQMEGKQVGQLKGAKLTTKKSVQAKEIILQNSRSFNGTMNDGDCIDLLRGKLGKMSRNTFYKYKKELEAENE